MLRRPCRLLLANTRSLHADEMVKTRIKENQHERIPTSDRQDNHCGSYCDCGRLTAHALEQLDGSIGAGFNTIASQIY